MHQEEQLSAPHTKRRRTVRVVLLDKQELHLALEPGARVREIFAQVCSHLSLREVEYFGLAQLVEDELRFVDLDAKVRKILPKSWKSNSKGEMGTLYFGVQYYVDQVLLLRERLTRHQYYLQLKNNLLRYRLLYSPERIFLLAAYALQADLGNYSPDKHRDAYFQVGDYFPEWVVTKYGEKFIEVNMPGMHRDLEGMSKLKAQMTFITDISTHPSAHNLHLYQLCKRKQDIQAPASLGICATGIHIFEEQESFKTLLTRFQWADIKNLHFEKKRFEIRTVGSSVERKFIYHTRSEAQARHLLGLARSTHHFERSQLIRVKELQLLEEREDRHRSYTEVCVGDVTASGRHRHHTSLDATVSHASNGSSTSGVVSERLHQSFDDEDMASAEIMITSPPSTNTSALLSPGMPRILDSLTKIPSARFKDMTREHFRELMMRTPTSGDPQSRSSGGSQHSMKGRLALLPDDSTPRPADAHICRVSALPTMTVQSRPTAVLPTPAVSLTASYNGTPGLSSATRMAIPMGHMHNIAPPLNIVQQNISLQTAAPQMGLHNNMATIQQNMIGTPQVAVGQHNMAHLNLAQQKVLHNTTPQIAQQLAISQGTPQMGISQSIAPHGLRQYMLASTPQMVPTLNNTSALNGVASYALSNAYATPEMSKYASSANAYGTPVITPYVTTSSVAAAAYSAPGMASYASTGNLYTALDVGSIDVGQRMLGVGTTREDFGQTVAQSIAQYHQIQTTAPSAQALTAQPLSNLFRPASRLPRLELRLPVSYHGQISGSKLQHRSQSDKVQVKPEFKFEPEDPACPVHGLRPDIAAEILGLSQKNQSLPLLSRLASDQTLLTGGKCLCNPRPSGLDDRIRRLSIPNSHMAHNDGSFLEESRPLKHSHSFNTHLQPYQIDVNAYEPAPPGYPMNGHIWADQPVRGIVLDTAGYANNGTNAGDNLAKAGVSVA